MKTNSLSSPSVDGNDLLIHEIHFSEGQEGSNPLKIFPSLRRQERTDLLRVQLFKEIVPKAREPQERENLVDQTGMENSEHESVGLSACARVMVGYPSIQSSCSCSMLSHAVLTQLCFTKISNKHNTFAFTCF